MKDNKGYTFKYESDDVEISYTVKGQHQLRDSLIEAFEDFLKACGYALPGKLVFEIEETEDEVLND